MIQANWSLVIIDRRRRQCLKHTDLRSLPALNLNKCLCIGRFSIWHSLLYIHKYIYLSIYKTHQQKMLENILILGNNTWNIQVNAIYQELKLTGFHQPLYEEPNKNNKIHTSCRSESSKLKLGRNRLTKETMLKTLRYKDFARFEVE